MEALRSFLARAEVVRSTARAAVDLDNWRDAELDLALLKDLHRAVVGEQASVRRVLQDGSSIIAPAQPGQLRTKPQAFRMGDHVELAWEQGRLKSGLVAFLREVAPRAARDPVAAAAQLAWALSRAQAFTGMNERVALVLVSWVLRRAGLPPLHVAEVERDPAFGAALVAATEEDRSTLARYLEGAIWDEALALVEWLGPVAVTPPERWTLADEHAATAQARATARKIATGDVESITREMATAIERELASQLAVRLAPARYEWLDSHASRLQCAWDAATRGRRICPHEPILSVRWSVADGLGLEAKLIVAAAGRGITGASSAHVALELAHQPVVGASPACLLIPDESANAGRERIAGWIERAIPRAIELSPLRV